MEQQPTDYPTKKQPICADCKTRTASIKRGKDTVCPDCYNEKPLPPLAQWDRVINPAFILSLENRIIDLETTVAQLTATHRSKQ